MLHATATFCDDQTAGSVAHMSGLITCDDQTAGSVAHACTDTHERRRPTTSLRDYDSWEVTYVC